MIRFQKSQEVRDRVNLERTSILIPFVLLFAFITSVRLLYIATFPTEKVKAAAMTQGFGISTLDAIRGPIFDQKGRTLTSELLNCYTVSCNPHDVYDQTGLANLLFHTIGVSKEQTLERLKQNKDYVVLANKVHYKDVQTLRQSKQNIQFKKDGQREYNYNDLAAQVLGPVNFEGHGASGIEFIYNEILLGMDGFEQFNYSPKGATFHNSRLRIQEPEDGNGVVLTIDVDFQSILERSLHKGNERFHSKTIGGLVMELPSNEIIAAANLPSFNLSSPSNVSEESKKLRVITDQVEAGSVMKMIPFIYLMEHNLIDLEQLIDCSKGYIVIGRDTLRDVKKSGLLNQKEGFIKSSNIVTYESCKNIPNKDLNELFNKFGFGKRTGIQLPGEAKGSISPYDKWNGIGKANIVIGYGISATMLQVATAYSVIANEGYYRTPTIVKGVLDKENKLKEEKRDKPRKVISKKSAESMTEWMVDVVDHGTAKSAQVKNVTIAAKTGTAEKYNVAIKKYDKTKHIASVVGFFPADNPKYLVLIYLDEPSGAAQGGYAAAPVFKEVVEGILMLQPELQATNEVEKQIVEHSNVVRSKKGTFEVKPDDEGFVEVPNFVNLTTREAIKIASMYGLALQPDGSGIVKRQRPKEGVRVKTGSICEVFTSGH